MPPTAPRRGGFAAITTALFLAAGLLLAEFLLRAFFEPYRIVTIGISDSDNADRYGWGYRPHQRFLLADPDTGQPLPSQANSRGWRDVEHAPGNRDGAFRVLVLGDSNTFGPIVAQDHMWPRLLERMARDAGYNIEVISLAYGAWGTDQKLEALIHEGLDYEPDLVILQYSANDVAFNVAPNDNTSGLPKPFLYGLDAGGRLQREANPGFALARQSPTARLKALLLRSEIIARLHGVYTRTRMKLDPSSTPYLVRDSQIERLGAVLDIDPGHPLLAYLRQRRDQSLSADDLRHAAQTHGLGERAELVLRICENRWFNHSWTPGQFDLKAVDAASYEWRLFFALIERVREVAASRRTPLAVFADIDATGYEWNTYWGLVRDSTHNRSRHLEPRLHVEAFARERGVGIVPNRRRHERARNDPHQNVIGTAAMAANVYDYLLEAHATALASHRMPVSAR